MDNRKELWVYAAGNGGRPDKECIDLLIKGRELAGESGYRLCAVAASSKPDAISEELAKYAEHVYCASVAENDEYNYKTVADILGKLAAEKEPDILLLSSSGIGGIVAGVLGIRLNTGVIAHSTDLRVEDGNLICSIPTFGGQAMGDIFCPEKRPQIATARVNVEASELEPFNGTIEYISADNAGGGELKLKAVSSEERAGASLSDAEVVVCCGAGIGTIENWEKLNAFAKKLGAAVCCTRSALDIGGEIDDSIMIGTSGSSIKPKVYIGFGVSGSMHHVCGMKDTGTVININKSENNPFFAYSDHGFVGDAGEILTQAIAQMK